LDLPITGAPEQTIHQGASVSKVAVLNDDFPLMKPRMHVAVGDAVSRGQILFEDRKAEGVRFTAPAGGTVVEINRGAKRKLQSVVVEIAADEVFSPFASYTGASPETLDGAAIKALLVESGVFTAVRARPFDRVPSPTETPAAVFITAIDTEPGAPDPDVVLKGHEDAFNTGVAALAKLTEGTTWLCRKPGAKIGTGASAPRLKVEEFKGKHPAGLVGTHIHLLDPVHRAKAVWHVGYQNVIAIGHLLATGKVFTRRVVALSGPQISTPRLIETRDGANIAELAAGQTKAGETRLISGSVLAGHTAAGPVAYLSRFTRQITGIAEGRDREFLGWVAPGANKYSTIRTYLAGFIGGGKKFALTTNTNGSHRAMVPIGMFERVMPLDIMPTFLLRAMIVDDVERAEKLGCLELGEEDLALCTFVSPGKEDYGDALRRNLTQIWKEG
jgi:Na+-transporting NADH:ubiquinone oxidoreductase subunit A